MMFMSCSLASAHLVQAAFRLVQAAFRLTGAPPVYGLWTALQVVFCGAMLTLDETPIWWRWFVQINPAYHLVTALLSLELGCGPEPAGAGVFGLAFLEQRLGFWDANLTSAVTVSGVYVIVFYALIALVLIWRDRNSRATYDKMMDAHGKTIRAPRTANAAYGANGEGGESDSRPSVDSAV